MGSVLALLGGRFNDFTLTELAVFVAVVENEGLTVSSVARLCRFTGATASRTIRRMAPPELPGALPPARGLLTLARGPHDNRSRHVFLTSYGRQLCDAINAIMADRARPGLSESNTDRLRANVAP